MEPVHKSLDEAHRVVGADIVVQGFGQQQKLGSGMAGDVRHVGILA